MNLSIVIPTINSSKKISKIVERLSETIKKIKEVETFEIILASQTCKDNTFEVIKNLEMPFLKKLYIQTKGKGIGLTEGMKIATKEYILMIDDDLPYNINEFLNKSKKYPEADIIIGSRYIKKMNHKSNIERKIASKGYRILVKLLFRIPQKDFQAGMKLIKKDVFKKIPFPKEKRYVWDTELLYYANRNKLKVVEIPVKYIHQENQLKLSKVIIEIFSDLLKLRIRLHGQHFSKNRTN